uniref:Uncharacterized protein n=1 Tax=Rhizophora mucronata TaxID=61149 RepID=A0A2P2J5E4_RHIMU
MISYTNKIDPNPKLNTVQSPSRESHERTRNKDMAHPRDPIL